MRFRLTTPFCLLTVVAAFALAAAPAWAQPELSWMDNSTNEENFEVERLESGAGSWMLLATLSADSTSHTDTSAVPNTDYCYRVRATNAAGASTYSNPACTSPDFGACGIADVVTVEMDILAGPSQEVFEACTEITGGPSLTLTTNADVIFRAGARVNLVDGFSVEGGAILEIAVDPTVGPVDP